MAAVAAFHAHVRKLFSSVDRKSGLILLAASGTNNAAELPFGETETADQATARTVALLAEDTKGGLAVAERTQQMAVAVEL